MDLFWLPRPWQGTLGRLRRCRQVACAQRQHYRGTARISTPRGAAVAIEKNFCSLEYEAKHVNAKIQKVVVNYIEAGEIPRDVRLPSYDRLVGQKSTFACALPP